jgi:hypothetical protein
VIVETPSGAIVGPGASGSSILLGAINAFVLLLSDGTNWRIIAGEVDSGWLSATYVGGSGSGTCRFRRKGNWVTANAYGQGLGEGSSFTVPSSYAPGTQEGSTNYLPALTTVSTAGTSFLLVYTIPAAEAIIMAAISGTFGSEEQWYFQISWTTDNA